MTNCISSTTLPCCGDNSCGHRPSIVRTSPARFERVSSFRLAPVVLTLAIAACSEPTGATGSIQLTISPATLSIVQGLAGTAIVDIGRTRFTGEVELSLLDPPGGITGTFNPNSASTDAAELVVRVAADVAPGDYPLTVQGTASGLPGRTVTVQLAVLPPPQGSTPIVLRFCGASEGPVFLAFQDGTGPWLDLTGAAVGEIVSYEFLLTQSHGGVVAVFPAAFVNAGRVPSARINRVPLVDAARARRRVATRASEVGSAQVPAYHTIVLYGSPAEITEEVSEGDCDSSEPIRMVAGNVQGVPEGAYGIISMGLTTNIFRGGISANPTTFAVPSGPMDLVGSRVVTPGAAPDRLLLFRDLEIPDGAPLPSPIDFEGPASFEPALASVTISGGGGDDLETFVDLVTASAQLGMWFDLDPNPTSTRAWAGLGPAKMRSSDFHALVVFATPPNNSPFDDYRVAVKYVGPVTDQTLALGPALSEPLTSQIATGAYPRFRFRGTLPTEYDRGLTIDLFGSTLFDTGNLFTILATGRYLAEVNGPLAYDFAMPDIAGLSGFPTASRLTAGATDLVLSGFGFDGPGFLEPRPAIGAQFKAAVKEGVLIVP